MNELINSLITTDQMLEIAFFPQEGTLDLFRGCLVKADSEAIAVRSADGHIRLMRLSSISYLDILPGAGAVAEMPTPDQEAIARAAQTEETGDADIDASRPSRSVIFSNTPVLTAPKVIGHIELPVSGTNTRFRRNTSDSDSTPDDSPKIPGMGRISRLGANFGFIQPNDPEASSIFLPRNEILSIHGLIKAPNVGDEVIYTKVANVKGMTAKCVHTACSLNTLEDMADRLAGYDPRNAAILRARIKAIQEGTPLEDLQIETISRRQRPATAAAPAPITDASTVLAMVARGEEVHARDITECENRLTEQLADTDYPNYVKSLDRLLGYSMHRNLSVIHRLFCRVIRVARDHDDTETALRFTRTACDFYQNHPGNYKFFSTLEYRITHPSVSDPSDSDDEAIMENMADDENQAPLTLASTEPAESTITGPVAEESASEYSDDVDDENGMITI